MNLTQDVTELLDALLLGIQEKLKHNLVGVYLRGSLVFGDFIPETSDIDVLAVTEYPINDDEFEALTALHTQVAAHPNPYAQRLEVAYIDRTAIKRFKAGLCHPTLGQGEILVWNEHHDNWILERWSVREHGIVLHGPDPRTLIDPISSGELVQAVRSRLSDWVEWAHQPDDPDWLLPRSHKAYTIETMCRVLYTLACGELSSKQQAVAWAIKTLPEPWRFTVKRSQEWRTDDTYDPEIVPEVRDFIFWVASSASCIGVR